MAGDSDPIPSFTVLLLGLIECISANSPKSHVRGRPEGELVPLPLPPVAKLLFGTDERDGNDMGTPAGCGSGLGFGGIGLAMCILELEFAVTLSRWRFRGAARSREPPHHLSPLASGASA